ncbi:hypothetical protein KAJ83_12225 [Marivibrio halodurans]|uniref:Type VI secretion system component TssM1 N-terminal domain-containing protein n=1 Tax=Marivibrio halodurans TaxID=2039722 RepID=A0A8J7SN37_9PROT|nr:type VI secretion protein IcmF/TssM N-terminal domain-containing protein [Marivibrio halodurans]MBP5857778.1 hypothetical protein [Marivibrio halodurans]
MRWLDAIRDFLIMLTPYLPSIIGMLVGFALTLLLVLWMLLRRSKQKPAGEAADTDARETQALDAAEPFQLEPDDLPLLPLKRSFKHALKLLKAHVAGRDWRYAIPWYLLIGPEGAGKSTLIAHTDQNLPVGAPAEDWEDVRPACKWWFFDHGVVLDIAGQFVRGRASRASNRRGWAQLLRLLDHHRPRRPVDGVILAIPIEDLLDEHGAPRPPEDVVQRAEAIYKKLWQAQSTLGLAFPVYVLVTKLDRLTGFQPFVRELPDSAHADILGWSSPYSIETEFRREWVDDAIDRIGAAVRARQMEIFAERPDLDEAEALFQLPAEIERLRAPLAQALRAIFKASAYHEAFSLRGLYLTGDGGVPAPPGLRPIPVLPGVYSGPKEEIRPVFLHDLFVEKIFPEDGLGRPARRALLSRNRTALAAQAASLALLVLGGAGLAWDYARVGAGVASVDPFIQAVRRDIAAEERFRRDAVARGETPGQRGSFDREKALALLAGMSRVDTDSFDSFFMPTSWVSSVDEEVVQVTTRAFNLFILQSMRAALAERGRAVVAGRLGAETGAESRGDTVAQALDAIGISSQAEAEPAVERGAAFQRLDGYVRALRRFEEAVARYNALDQTRDLRDLKALVAYLFDVVLPEEFVENSGFYEAALDSVEYQALDLSSFRAPAVERYHALAEEALPSLFADNPLITALRQLGILIDDAANRRTGGIDMLEDLRARIAAIRGMFDAPRFAWMEDPDFDPASQLGGVIERIGGASLLGPDLAEGFRRRAEQGLADVRGELPDLRANTIGALLAREGDRPVLRFAEPVAALDTLVSALFQRPFMADGRLQPLPAAPPTGVVALWNAERLGEATGLIDGYRDFMQNDLVRAPSTLHPMIRAAAAERLTRTVDDRVARALEVGGDGRTAGLRQEESLRRSVASFTGAAQPLARILATYDDLAMEDSYLDLGDLVLGHAVGLLQEADTLFAEEAFYEPQGGDFRWWQGEARMALDAYRARDRFELNDILTRQRERIGLIARDYVRPVATFLDEREVRLPEAAENLVARWRRIADELEKYSLRRADNSVAELESFITGPMMTISFADCGETLDAVADDGGGGDFFTARMSRLIRGIRDRCGDLAGVQAQISYSEIRDAFDTRLAGRYPFVSGGYRPDLPEVGPRELADFFALYDREVGPARNALRESVDLGLARERALDFLDRMDRARALFAPWLGAPGVDDGPVYDVTASFRVNRERESGANQVIDWSLSVGGTRLDQRSGDRTARWGLGEAVRLTLRWAGNSTAVPVPVPERPELSVSDRTVTIGYDNAWSLLELIRRHRAGSDDFAQFVDPRPHTLRVDLPTRPAAGGPVETARLFLRVELSAQADGGAVPVTVPVFPASAPDIGE